MRKMKMMVCLLLIILGIPTVCLHAEEAEPDFYIENEHVYEGMDQSYSDGYIPKIKDGKAIVVLPIQCNVELKNQSVRAMIFFTEDERNPFVRKNYVKTVKFHEKDSIYPVVFEMELQKERWNGSYPLQIQLDAITDSNHIIKKEIQLYVNITDGKLEISENEEPQGEQEEVPPVEPPVSEPQGDAQTDAQTDTQSDAQAEAPVFAPKLIVKACEFSEKEIVAGEEFSLEITLKNTSKKQAAKNLTVMISGQGEYFQLLDKTDTTFIEKIRAGKTTTFIYHYRVYPSTPQAQYTLELALDYAGEDGTAYSSTGKVHVPVVQPMRVEVDALDLPGKLPVADVITAGMQVMNLGRSKIYHVRAVIEADGLRPEGTIFIGDMEPGASAEGTTEITIEGLEKGESAYGETVGKLILYYEDELGHEYKEEKEIQSEIVAPFVEEEPIEEENSEQWLVIMSVLLTILVMLILLWIGRWWKKRKEENELFE